MEVHLKVIGILLMGLSAVHLFFPKYFNWGEDLKFLSLINRQMMYVHAFFIALALFLMGLLCLTSFDDLLHSEFGKRITLGFGLFWIIRLIIQFFGYSSKLWKGKKFETAIHILFSLLWTYLSLVFILASFRD